MQPYRVPNDGPQSASTAVLLLSAAEAADVLVGGDEHALYYVGHDPVIARHSGDMPRLRTFLDLPVQIRFTVPLRPSPGSLPGWPPAGLPRLRPPPPVRGFPAAEAPSNPPSYFCDRRKHHPFRHLHRVPYGLLIRRSWVRVPAASLAKQAGEPAIPRGSPAFAFTAHLDGLRNTTLVTPLLFLGILRQAREIGSEQFSRRIGPPSFDSNARRRAIQLYTGRSLQSMSRRKPFWHTLGHMHAKCAVMANVH